MNSVRPIARTSGKRCTLAATAALSALIGCGRSELSVPRSPGATGVDAAVEAALRDSSAGDSSDPAADSAIDSPIVRGDVRSDDAVSESPDAPPDAPDALTTIVDAAALDVRIVPTFILSAAPEGVLVGTGDNAVTSLAVDGRALFIPRYVFPGAVGPGTGGGIMGVAAGSGHRAAITWDSNLGCSFLQLDATDQPAGPIGIAVHDSCSDLHPRADGYDFLVGTDPGPPGTLSLARTAFDGTLRGVSLLGSGDITGARRAEQPDDSFALVWEQRSSGRIDVTVQSFASDGIPTGAPTSVATTGFTDGLAAAILATRSGYLVAWIDLVASGHPDRVIRTITVDTMGHPLSVPVTIETSARTIRDLFLTSDGATAWLSWYVVPGPAEVWSVHLGPAGIPFGTSVRVASDPGIESLAAAAIPSGTMLLFHVARGPNYTHVAIVRSGP